LRGIFDLKIKYFSYAIQDLFSLLQKGSLNPQAVRIRVKGIFYIFEMARQAKNYGFDRFPFAGTGPMPVRLWAPCTNQGRCSENNRLTVSFPPIKSEYG
jgi:hypothetical protein